MPRKNRFAPRVHAIANTSSTSSPPAASSAACAVPTTRSCRITSIWSPSAARPNHFALHDGVERPLRHLPVHRHTGHLWQSRFYSAVLDSAPWATALRHVEGGPNRTDAVLVRHRFHRHRPTPQAGDLLARTQSVYNFGVRLAEAAAGS